MPSICATWSMIPSSPSSAGSSKTAPAPSPKMMQIARSVKSVIDADESADHVLERGGNGGRIDVGEMGFAVHHVVMEAGVEGAGGLPGGAAERDPVAAAGDVVGLQG